MCEYSFKLKKENERIKAIEYKLNIIPETEKEIMNYYIYFKEDMKWLLARYKELKNV